MLTRWRVGAALAMLLLGGLGWAAEPVAVLTELRPGSGEIRVKRAGESDWVVPQPLLALRAGDQVRVTGDARAVVVFTGGRGAETVSQANSPLVVQAPTAESGVDKLRSLLGGITQFLLGQQKEVAYRSLSVRSLPAQPPVIISPRETRLLPGPVTFEWGGSDRLRYRLRVSAPQGLLWEQANLRRQPVEYPASESPLRAGVQYTWALEAPGHPVQQAQFEILPDAEVARVRSALAELQPGRLVGYPPNTVALMRAGLLVQERLYHEARRELLAALAADPDEPGLHLLLGHVYDRVGLQELAAQEFDEAQFLSTVKP